MRSSTPAPEQDLRKLRRSLGGRVYPQSLTSDYDVTRLREARGAVEYAIFRALRHALSPANEDRTRSRATSKLAHLVRGTRTAIISLNYDVLIDIALATQSQGSVMDEAADWFQFPEIRGIDYGVEFKGAPPARGVGDGNELIPLYKLHGSFNWLCSTSTGDLFYSGLNKSAVSDYFERPQRLEPTYGQGPESLAPVLITPTHLKDMRNYHLARIWRAAETALREARRVLFIGYSLPGDDLHIKYLLKRSIATRERGAGPARVAVVDKGAESKSEVASRYRRFFGQIEYFGGGFDAFMKSARARTLIRG